MSILSSFRLRFFHLLAMIALAAVGFLAPQQLPVVLYKAALVIGAVILGYWLDRHMHPYCQPRSLLAMLHAARDDSDKDRVAYILAHTMYRRVLIVASVAIAFSLAL